MKKAILLLLTTATLLFTGCVDTTTHVASADAYDATENPVKISYVAEFYDNEGLNWLNVEGTSFDIKPNKVKQYGAYVVLEK